MTDIKILLEKLEILKSERGSWDRSREDIKKYVCPSSERAKDVLASLPSYAASSLASNLQSILVNPSSQWFSLNLVEIEKEDEDAIGWSQKITESINEVLNCRATNFYTQIHEFFLTLVTYGTAVFYIEEDPKLPFFSFFRNIPLEECFFEENRFRFVDTIYRNFKISLKIASEIWSDNVKLRAKAIKFPNEKLDILHVVQPKKDNSIKSFESLYISLEDKELLSESLYNYFPFLVTRWVQHSDSPYGYAPAHHVMSEIILLNKYRTFAIKAKQKEDEPALLVPRHGYRLPLINTPGHVNFYDNSIADKIHRLTSIENPRPTLEEQEKCEIAIRTSFYMDVFRLPKINKEMTASEVNVRSEEQMRMMSPIVGRIETELLDPLIRNIFNILMKYKRINLENTKNLSIETHYISPLSRVQRLESTRSMEHVLAFLLNSGIAKISPEVLDSFNFDEVLKLYAQSHNCPQNIFLKKEEVEEIRRMRNSQQESNQSEQTIDRMQ